MGAIEDALSKLAQSVASIADGLAKHEKRIKALEQREPHGQAITEGKPNGDEPGS